jgi:serine/threonine protein kinase
LGQTAKTGPRAASVLRPANFLIKRDKKGLIYLHLNDFGTAKSTIIDEKRINTAIGDSVGTIEYMAPEILNAKTYKPTDIIK